MGEEIKVVTRQETFNDLAVRELAKTRSACICRLQFKRCDKAECAHCEIGKQYRNCYNAMNDYDRNRLAGYIAERYAIDSRNPEHWMNHKRYAKYTLSWIFGGFLLLLLLFALIAYAAEGPFARPNKEQIPKDIDVKIVTTIMKIQMDIHDVDGDNKVNCIDYATTFKIFWDRDYPDLKGWCSIVRNKGPGIHHLFIKIWDGVWEIEVEPWTQNPYRYLMAENWTDVYDPNNNIYGETSRWLKEVKDGY